MISAILVTLFLDNAPVVVGEVAAVGLATGGCILLIRMARLQETRVAGGAVWCAKVLAVFGFFTTAASLTALWIVLKVSSPMGG